MPSQQTEQDGGEKVVPRFGVKSLLVATAVIAAWLSMFSGYVAPMYVRSTIMLGILFSALFTAMYTRGRRRAFWTGFVIAMLLANTGNVMKSYFAYLSVFDIPDEISRVAAGPPTNINFSPQLPLPLHYTIREVFNLVLAIIVGGLAVFVYDRNRVYD